MNNRNFRFWLIYWLVWLPYLAGYVTVFLAQGGSSVNSALRTGLYNVGSAALCGVGVVLLCELLPYKFVYRWWFFPAQIWFSAVYSVGWFAILMTILTANYFFETGKFELIIFSGPALLWQLFAGAMIYGTIASMVYVAQTAAVLRTASERAARRGFARARRTRRFARPAQPAFFI